MDGLQEVLQRIEEKYTNQSEPQFETKVACCQCGSENIVRSVKEKVYGLDYNQTRNYCGLCWSGKVAVKIKQTFPVKFQTVLTDKTGQIKGLNNKSVFLTGDPGTGKTVFVCSYGKQFIDQGLDVKFYSYPSLIIEFQSLFKDETESLDDKLYKLYTFDGLLILDDMGGEKITDFVRQITYVIINEREMRCLPVAITSNYSLAQLAEQIDQRISSRIAGMCDVIKLTGKDRRIK